MGGHVTGKRDMRKAYKILVGKSDCFADVTCKGENNIKMILKE
jgi:hypothetical protein